MTDPDFLAEMAKLQLPVHPFERPSEKCADRYLDGHAGEGRGRRKTDLRVVRLTPYAMRELAELKAKGQRERSSGIKFALSKQSGQMTCLEPVDWTEEVPLSEWHTAMS